MQLALVEHAIKLATLGVAERGTVRRAGLQVAELEPLPLPHTVLASVLRPIRKAMGTVSILLAPNAKQQLLHPTILPFTLLHPQGLP